MSRLAYLLTLTPLETWRIVRHRLPILRGHSSWTANELLSSAKHSRGIRFAELLLRQEAIVQRHVPQWRTIEFEGRRVVEVGCGPLAGYGPLAIFRGAQSFESADPEWDADLFFSREIGEKYLRIFHADLTALYGPRMDFGGFLDALKRKMKVARCGFEDAPIDGFVDVVLSQSALEHVFPLDATLKKLSEIQNASTRSLHLVDFGNHYPTANPFEGLYSSTPEEYIAARGKAVNCLRSSDVMRLFSEAGIPTTLVPSRVVEVRGPIGSFWQTRYPEDVLGTQLALIVTPS